MVKDAKFLMGLRDDMHTQLMYEGVLSYIVAIATTYKVEQVNVKQLKVGTSSQETKNKENKSRNSRR